MTYYLRTLMETYNCSPSEHCEPLYYERPAKLLTLFSKYNITSIFDSGCKDRHWMRHLDCAANNIKYTGGEISRPMVDICHELFPDVEVIQHDATQDPFPDVDLLFSSDVMIHLNNEDKLKFLKNFCNSNIKYLLMTDSAWPGPNIDAVYNKDCAEFPFEHITWNKEPWNFPRAIDAISDYENDERLKLWTREQIKEAIK